MRVPMGFKVLAIEPKGDDSSTPVAQHVFMRIFFISPQLWSIRRKNKCFYLPSCRGYNSLFNLTPQFIQTCFVDRRDAHTLVTQHARFYIQTFLVTGMKQAVCKGIEQKSKLYTRYNPPRNKVNLMCYL